MSDESHETAIWIEKRKYRGQEKQFSARAEVRDARCGALMSFAPLRRSLGRGAAERATSWTAKNGALGRQVAKSHQRYMTSRTSAMI